MAYITWEDSNINAYDHDAMYTFFSGTYPLHDNTEDGGMRNWLLDAVTYAIGKNSDIPEEIFKANKSSGQEISLENYYIYGRDHHPFGLPDFIKTIKKSSLTNTTALQILSTEFSVPISSFTDIKFYYTEGSPPAPINFMVDPNDYIDDFYIFLQKKILYNSFTNLVDITSTVLTLGFSFNILPINYSNYLLRLKPENIKMIGPISVLSQEVDVSYTFELIDKTTQAIIYTNLIRSFNLNSIFTDYHYFSYRTIEQDSTEENKIFIYPHNPIWQRINYPEIFIITETINTGKDLYPMMPLKVLYQEIAKGHELYEPTAALAKKLGIDLEFLIEGLKNKNPDYTNIHSAYLLIAANFNSENAYELMYIFDYFADTALLGNFDFNAAAENFKLTLRETSIPNLNTFFKNFGIKGMDIVSYTGIMPNENVIGMKRFIGNSGEIDSFRICVIANKYYLARQMTKDSWIEITLLTPYSATAVGKGFFTLVSASSLNEFPNELRLPIERSRLQKYSAVIAKEIILRSICIQIGGITKTSLKFYETQDFAKHLKRVYIIVIIIDIILICFGIVDISEFLIGMLIGTLAGLVLEIVFYLLEPLIGAEAAGVITIAAGVVISYYSAGSKMDTTSLVTSVLQYTNAVSGIYSNFTIEEIEELQKENQFFNKRADEILEDLEKIKQGLSPNELNPFILGLLDKKDIVIETPAEFFFRTTHVGNPGVRTLNYSSTFVSNALQLPDLIKEDF